MSLLESRVFGLIQVDDRDPRDFTVDLGTFERLAPRLAGATLVAELSPLP